MKKLVEALKKELGEALSPTRYPVEHEIAKKIVGSMGRELKQSDSPETMVAQSAHSFAKYDPQYRGKKVDAEIVWEYVSQMMGL